MFPNKFPNTFPSKFPKKVPKQVSKYRSRTPQARTGLQSACSSWRRLKATGRSAIGHARVTRAIGHSIDRGIAAEREGCGSGATDGPATFARRQVQQRTGLRADDIV